MSQVIPLDLKYLEENKVPITEVDLFLVLKGNPNSIDKKNAEIIHSIVTNFADRYPNGIIVGSMYYSSLTDQQGLEFKQYLCSLQKWSC